MNSAIAEREPILAEQQEMGTFAALEAYLHDETAATRPRLIGPGGETELPDSLYSVLVRAVHELARGNGISILPIEAEVTTQQAADQLSVSRPYLIKLLEGGEIPFHMVGTHRRVKLIDLLDYRARRDDARETALDNMARQAVELGLY